MAIIVTLGRRAVRYGLSIDIFRNDFIAELILSILTLVIILIIDENKKS